MPERTPFKGKSAPAVQLSWAWVALSTVCILAIVSAPEISSFVVVIRDIIGDSIPASDFWAVYCSFQDGYAEWRERPIVEWLLGPRVSCLTISNGKRCVYFALNWPFSFVPATVVYYAEQVTLLSVLGCFASAASFAFYAITRQCIYKVVDTDKRPFLQFVKWVGLIAGLISTYVVCPAVACSIVAWWFVSVSVAVINSTPYRLPYVKVVDDGFLDDPWLTPDPLSAARKSGVTERKEMACPGSHSAPVTFDKVPYAFLICTPGWEGVLGFGFRIHIGGHDRVVTAKHVYDAAMERDTSIWIAGKSGRTSFKPKVMMSSRALDYVYIESPVKQLSAAGVVRGTYCTSSENLPVSILSPPTDDSGTFMYSSCGVARSRSAFRVSYVANTIKGSSGSPIYTTKGIIGVHTGSNGDRSSPRNYGSILVDPSVDFRAAMSTDSADDGVVETTAPRRKGFAVYDEDLMEAERILDLAFGPEGNASHAYFPVSGLKFGRASISAEDKWEEMQERLKKTGKPLWADMDDDERAEAAAENVEPPQKTQGVALSGATRRVPPSPSNGVFSKTAKSFSSPYGVSLTSKKSENQESAKQTASSTLSDLTQNADLLRTISRLLEQQEKLLSFVNGPHQTEAQKQKPHPSDIRPALSKPAASPQKKSPRTSSSGCSPSIQPATKPINTTISKIGAGKVK